MSDGDGNDEKKGVDTEKVNISCKSGARPGDGVCDSQTAEKRELPNGIVRYTCVECGHKWTAPATGKRLDI